MLIKTGFYMIISLPFTHWNKNNNKFDVNKYNWSFQEATRNFQTWMMLTLDYCPSYYFNDIILEAYWWSFYL